MSPALVRFTSVVEGHRVAYTVQRCGVFMVEPEPYECPWTGRVLVSYGRQRYGLREPAESAPCVFGVPLANGSVFDPVQMDLERVGMWLRVFRPTGLHTVREVPDRTRDRVGVIVRALVTDWLARADLLQLVDAANRVHAPGRRDHVQREMQRLETQRADLAEQLQRLQSRLDALGPYLQPATQ